MDAPNALPGPACEPARTVIEGDGLAWLAQNTLGPTQAIVTSLPDLSELSSRSFEAWRDGFVEAAALVCAKVADTGVAVFYQTDVRRPERWVDKAYLVAQGAERAGAACLFHKIVCRAPAGTATFGRPGYAHLLAFSRGLRVPMAESSADVLPELGEMTWARAMGTEACEAVCRFLLRSTACRVLIDPFCGLGTMLAVANAYGLDALGIEISGKRAGQARQLRFQRGVGIR